MPGWTEVSLESVRAAIKYGSARRVNYKPGDELPRAETGRFLVAIVANGGVENAFDVTDPADLATVLQEASPEMLVWASLELWSVPSAEVAPGRASEMLK